MSLLSILPFLSCAQGGDKPQPHIVHFNYNYDGTIGGNNHRYKLDVQDGQAKLTIEDMMHWDYGEMTDTIDMSFVQALEAMCDKHDVSKFDGFNKTNPHVCDGSGFSLYIKYDNGKSVSAHGMNSSPRGYHEFAGDMYELFKPYCELFYQKALQRKKEKGVSGPLKYIGTNFFQSGASGSDRYETVFSTHEGRMYNVEIKIRSVSGEFFPKGEFTLYKKVPNDKINWDAFAALVKKHDLVQWMDFNQSAEDYNNEEWFQLDWNFENGRIDAYGTAHPEHYDAFRKDFLTLLRQTVDALNDEKE